MKITITTLKNVKTNVNNLTKQIRETPVTGFIRSALIGLILTDAGAYRSKVHSGNTRIEWSFGSSYRAFALYINILFTNYINTPLTSVSVKTTTATQYRLKTVSLPIGPLFKKRGR